MSRETVRISSLDEALARLEPASASPGFTQRVLATLPGREPRRSATGIWLFAAAAAAAIALGVFLGLRAEPSAARLAAERESLLLEHSELVRELESLRAMARDAGPVLYLGAEQETDLVLDLSSLLEEPAAEARPASLQGDDQPTHYY